MVIGLVESISTSSFVPGKAPLLQFVGVFQSPFPPTQATEAATSVKEEAQATKQAAKNIFANFFTKALRVLVEFGLR